MCVQSYNAIRAHVLSAEVLLYSLIVALITESVQFETKTKMRRMNGNPFHYSHGEESIFDSFCSEPFDSLNDSCRQVERESD